MHVLSKTLFTHSQAKEEDIFLLFFNCLMKMEPDSAEGTFCLEERH